MKDSIKHYKNASYAALLFVILGYIVKFYPDYLTGFDTSIQTAIRGDLPASASQFWTTITVLGNALPLFAIVLALFAFFLWKKWKAEAYFLVGSLVLMLVAGVLAIIVYQRCQNKPIRLLVQGLLIGTAILVALSRIYIGVHFPTDIIAGWLLALTLLWALYPTYDRYRFTWRFQSKQK